MATAVCKYLEDHPEIGIPMPVSGFRRLIYYDTSHVKIPQYKKHHFHSLMNVVTYKVFRDDVDHFNVSTFIDRPSMDSSWVKLLCSKFVLWNKYELTKSQGAGNEETYMMKVLHKAIKTTRGTDRDDVEGYWARRAEIAPGLNIIPLEYDDDTDHAPQPEWDEIPAGLTTEETVAFMEKWSRERVEDRLSDTEETPSGKFVEGDSWEGMDEGMDVDDGGEQGDVASTVFAFRPKEKNEGMDLDG